MSTTDPSTDDTVRAAIAEWQKRLLQLDRRNRLLFFKPDATTVVPFIGDDVDGFATDLAAASAGLSFARPRFPSRGKSTSTPSDPNNFVPGDLETSLAVGELQRRLTRLRQRDREFTEEQGINVLFVAVGVLHWVDEEDKPGTAPLLLIPCDLHRASPRDAFFLKQEDEDPIGNATLMHKLRDHLNVAIPEFEPDQSPSSYLQSVEAAIRNQDGWWVERKTYLSTFQYSKIAMWEDLEQLRKSPDIEHPIVRALGGDTGVEFQNVPAGDEWHSLDLSRLVGGGLDDHVDPQDIPLILQADFSQLQTVGAALSGQHLVVHGPPGTGKSQTIANIIAANIAGGRSVLFVSEKSAALDIVKQRLERANLGVFCLDLHSQRAKKSNVYDQLRQSLNADPLVQSTRFDFDAIRERRRRLNAYVRAVHRSRPPLNRTVHQAHGRLAHVRDAPQVELKIPDAGSMTSTDLESAVELARRVANRPNEFAVHFKSDWRVLRDEQPGFGYAQQLASALDHASVGPRELVSSTEDTLAWLGLEPAQTASEIARAARIADLLSQAPGVERVWCDPDNAARLTKRAEVLEGEQQRYLRAVEHRTTQFASTPVGGFRQLDSRLQDALPARPVAERLFGSDWNARIISELDVLLEAVARIPEVARAIQVDATALAQELQAQEETSPAKLRDLLDTAASVLELGPVPESWLGRDQEADLLELLDDGERKLRELNSAEQHLFERYDEGFVEQASQELLVRFRTTYRSKLRFLRSQYRADKRLLQGYSRTATNPSLDEATSAIEDALQVQRHRSEWDELGVRLQAEFGRYFRGRSTDIPYIRGRVEQARKLHASLGSTTQARTLLSSEDAQARLRRLTESVRTQLAQLEALEQQLNPSPNPQRDSYPAEHLSDVCAEIEPDLQGLDAVLQELTPHLKAPPSDFQQLRTALAAAAEAEDLDRELAEQASPLKRDFGQRFDGWNTRWPDIREALKWTESFLAEVGRRASGTTIDHAVSPQAPESYRDARDSRRTRLATFRKEMEPLDARVDPARTPWGSWDAAAFEELSSWIDRLRSDVDSAASWLDYRQAVLAYERRFGTGSVDRIREATDQPLEVPRITERAIWEAWLQAMTADDPVLHEFRGTDHERVMEEFRELDEAMPRAAQREVARKAFERYPPRALLTGQPGELGVIRSQLSKKRKQLPVRKLFQRTPTQLPRLKPCIMMSPLAVSQFLPRSELATDNIEFDVVIFDEASQVFPEDAIPAISRGKQVIVVGDEHQLPPTSFFRKVEGADDEESDDDEDEEAADGLVQRESILNALQGGSLFGRGVFERYLNVHYRSHHENLIRFSNHHFYEDRLLVFPSPYLRDEGLGLQDVYVPEGRFESGGSRTNPIEAQRVVDIVFDRLRNLPTEESLGVVALSRAQSDLIQRLIDERRLQETDLEHRFRDELDEPFFVKNLENVQGDERDHIILSIGYGPSAATGQVYQRFGPINSEPGRRRLNVAVSRARASMTVVRSMRPDQITGESPGALLLRRYLEFVANPTIAIEGETSEDLDAETESPFEEAVYRRLSERYDVGKQIGVAGFRIDLAIKSPDGSRYELGIECDGATYHRAPSARDRDLLRQDILEKLGWCIHRIWSTDWNLNPEAEVRRVEEALERCRAHRHTKHGAEDNRDPNNVSGGDNPGWTVESDQGLRASAPPAEHMFEDYQSPADLVDWNWNELGELDAERARAVVLSLVRCAGVLTWPELKVAQSRLRLHFRSRPLEDAASALIEEGLLSTEANVQYSRYALWEDLSAVRPRRRRGLTANAEAAASIPGVEMASGLLKVLRAVGRCETYELLRETAIQFGFAQLRQPVREALERALNELENRGDVAWDREADTVRPIATADGALSSDPPSGEPASVEATPGEGEPNSEIPGASRNTAAEESTAGSASPGHSRREGEQAGFPLDESDTNHRGTGLERPSVEAVIRNLTDAGFTVLDKRAKGGAVWIVGGIDQRSRILELAPGYRLSHKRSPRATGHRPAWWLVT